MFMYTLKNLIASVVLTLLVTVTAFAQTVNGIYLTKADFDNDVITYPSITGSDVLKELREGNIKLIRDGKELSFQFGDFYGYTDRGYKFISFGHKSVLKPYGYYQVIDQSGLIVYKQRVPHPKYIYVEQPYFSVSPEGLKCSLTVKHLKQQLALNHAEVAEVRWFKNNTGSLALIVNDRAIINSLLFKEHQGLTQP
jgi:hypothetical protein